MLRRQGSLILVCMLVLIISGCNLLFPPPKPTGNLTIHTLVPSSLESQEIELILNQGGNHSTVFLFPLQGEENLLRVDELYTGEWTVIINLKNNEGVITHTGNTQVEILPDQTTLTNLSLLPNNGIIRVIIDLTSMADEALVQRARLSVEPGGYNSSTRQEGSYVIEVQREVSPRTYDYRISLYGEGSSAEHLIYASPWYQTTVDPGKVNTIYWSVTSGSMELVSEIISLPLPPANPEANHLGNGTIEITWTPNPDPSITGYRIYVKDKLSGPFKLEEEVGADQNRCEINLRLKSTEQTIYMAVSAYSAEGFESFRTDPLEVSLPAKN
jgi:hypothetical protein